MTKNIELKYKFIKESLVKKLQMANYYCFTCDNWSDVTNQSYIGVTIHYLNETFVMKNACIGCFPLEESHTSDYLILFLRDIFNTFNINDDKITAIISDGKAAIKKACIEIVGKERHLVYIAHVVSHLIPDALKSLTDLTNIINKIKSTVTIIKRSMPASDKLKALQLQSGKSEGTVLKLIQDVPTRWTTKIDMIERYFELEQFEYLALSECENPEDLPDREEVKALKDVLPIMELIQEVINEISGSLYPMQV